MKIVFFEIENWEKEILQKSFPNAVFVERELCSENAGQFQDANIISIFINSSLTKDVIQKLSSLKAIMTRSTGFDHINIPYCKEKNIPVCNVPGYGSHTVAEYTFALLLSLTRKISDSQKELQSSKVRRATIRGVDLNGKTLGVIGSGKIGQNVIKIAQGFGMKIIVYDIYRNSELSKLLNFEYVDLLYLLKNSDVVTLHVPLTQENHHLINIQNINAFKRGSFLINTARGGLIETKAIENGLKKGTLSGVGLDVLEDEISENHFLTNQPNVIITPHNAFNTNEALRRILTTTIENIDMYLKRTTHNKVI